MILQTKSEQRSVVVESFKLSVFLQELRLILSPIRHQAPQQKLYLKTQHQNKSYLDIFRMHIKLFVLPFYFLEVI